MAYDGGIFDSRVYGEPVYNDALIVPEVYGEGLLTDVQRVFSVDAHIHSAEGADGLFRLGAVISLRYFTVDALINPIFTVDAMISSGHFVVAAFVTNRSAFQYDAFQHDTFQIELPAGTGEIPVRAIVLSPVARSFTVAAWFAWRIYASATLDARIMPRFSINAVIFKTQEFTSVSTPPSNLKLDYRWGPGGSFSINALVKVVRSTWDPIVDLALGMPVAVSGSFSLDPWVIVDGNDSTYHQAAAYNGQWARVDLGRKVGVSRYRLKQGSYGQASGLYLEYSDDGTNFAIADTRTGLGLDQTFDIANSPRGRYWRVRVNPDSTGWSWRIYTLSLWVGNLPDPILLDAMVSNGHFTLDAWLWIGDADLRASQAGFETAWTGTPNVWLSQGGVEVAYANPSGDFTVDAVIAVITTVTGSFPVNAWLRGWGTFRLDSWLWIGNANLQLSQTGFETAWTGNPNVGPSQAGYEIAYEKSKGLFTANARLAIITHPESSFSVAAWLRGWGSYTVDAWLWTGDAGVRVTQFGYHRARTAVIINNQLSQAGIEVVRGGFPGDVPSQAGFEVAYEKAKGTFAANAAINRPGDLMTPATFTLDAYKVFIIHLNAVISVPTTASFGVDAAFVRNIAGAFTLDAEVQMGLLLNATLLRIQQSIFMLYARKIVKTTGGGTFGVDAFKSGFFTVGAWITKPRPFTLDAAIILAGKYLKSFYANAVVASFARSGEFLLEADITTLRTVVYEGQGSSRVIRNLITERLSIPGFRSPVVDVNGVYGPFYPIDFTPVTLTIYDLEPAGDLIDDRSIGIHAANETNLWNWYTGPGTYTFWPSDYFIEHYAYTWPGPFNPSVTGSGMISFYRDDTVIDTLPAPTLDAWLVGTPGEPFTLDAEIVGREKLGSFILEADLMKAGEKRTTFPVESLLLSGQWGFFGISAAMGYPSFRVDAVLYMAPFTATSSFAADAVRIVSQPGSSKTINAVIVRHVSYDAYTINADIVSTSEHRGLVFLDSLVVGTRPAKRFYLAAIIASTPSSFTVGAVIAGWITLDAQIVSSSGGKGIFTVGAYVRGSSYIIFPDDGGAPTDPFGNPPGVARKFSIKIEAGFTDPTPSNQAEINRILALIMEAEDDLASLTCIPEAERLPVENEEIALQRQYIADLKAELAAAQALDPAHKYWAAMARMQYLVNIYLAIPSSQRTPHQQASLEIDQKQLAYDTMQYRIARNPKRRWVDITGDVIWSGTEFNQQARTGPGSFTITMKGAQPDFKGGEEIHFEIDDLRVFGGWVTDVQKDSFFADIEEPRTVLHGTDYNILFDRLVIRNYPWELANYYATGDNMGPYQSWKPYKQYTMDDVMIRHAFRNYIAPDLPPEFDWEDQVDAITTPAPVSPWVMPEAGSTLRSFMQSISMITTGIWYIDPYMGLHYHERGKVTAPYPITDGVGGISSRGLRVTTDISSMINDVIVWGTLAKTVKGEIMVWHEVGDGTWWERRYRDAIKHDQAVLMKLYAIPPSERTDWQDEAIVRYRNAVALYKKRLADVLANTWDPDSGLPRPANAQIDSIGHWGRWQHGEFREDIHHQEWLNRRGHSILVRYDEPIVKATATVWDPGYQAGQVVTVKSAVYGVNVDLVIRALKISFTVPKEPVGGVFYALPQYDLEMGINPDSPWNIYDYLPFPGQGTPGLRMDTTGGL